MRKLLLLSLLIFSFNIEKGNINYQIFNNLTYDQWTLEEVRSDQASDYIKEITV